MEGKEPRPGNRERKINDNLLEKKKLMADVLSCCLFYYYSFIRFISISYSNVISGAEVRGWENGTANDHYFYRIHPVHASKYF